MTMDLDATVCQVHGDHTHGAADGDTHTLGYHPLVATRAGTGEVLPRPPADRAGQHRPRRGPLRRRAGRTGAPRRRQRELAMRADSGFWSAKTVRACRRHRIRSSVTVRQTTPIRAAIATIPQHAWTPIVYPDGASPRSPRPATGVTG
jgi:Transposase DDE domain group 1